MDYPPTDLKIQQLMMHVLNITDKQDIKALIFCDNPDIIIFDPIKSMIRCRSIEAKAKFKGRSIELIIGEID